MTGAKVVVIFEKSKKNLNFVFFISIFLSLEG